VATRGIPVSRGTSLFAMVKRPMEGIATFYKARSGR
jgi:hypothetical protein